MRSIVILLLIGLSASFRSRVELQAAIATRHHQLEVLHRRAVRPRLRPADRTGKLGREWARHSVCVGRRPGWSKDRAERIRSQPRLEVGRFNRCCMSAAARRDDLVHEPPVLGSLFSA